MTPLTPAWTSARTALAIAAGIIAACALAAGGEPWPVRVLLGLVLCIAFAGALAFDAFAGAVIGLAGAAALIVGRRQLGDWGPGVFEASALQTFALVLVGILAGYAGSHLRSTAGLARERDQGEPNDGIDVPGLLDLEFGTVRLEEEVGRAVLHERPLAVLRLSVHVHAHDDHSVSPPYRQALQRAVARVFESLLRPTDVPFLIDVGELGAALPETTSTEALDIVISILDAMATATFVGGSAGARWQIGDHADISFGLAFLGEHGMTAHELLSAAATAAGSHGGEPAGTR